MVLYVWGVVVVCSLLLTHHNGALSMGPTEKKHYKDKVLEIFNHAYRSYMDFAYPADELMPLTCKGRVWGVEQGRGDIDFTLGRFSLTLIDTLDTLAVIGSVDEFSSAVQKVMTDISFDSDLVVSVFETNIRVLGGLLGGHFAALALKEKGYHQLAWYDGGLLRMAVEVGNRLLPAFNTTTGLPYPKINLRHGMGYPNMEKTTCTACAGSMILEFAALSRLTGDPEVSMNSPHRMTRYFMDSLLAFWPGLQVLWGDVDTAIHIHDMLYHVMERHNFLPEAFTHDFRVHWGNHPLRPEFIESTYFLYKATGDPYYLDVGRSVVNNLNKYARVRCGFAAIKDLKTNTHEDRMDSFVLAETFKYLFLLFADEGDSPLNMDDFVFTTEAHLFPLSLASANTTLNRVVQEALLVKNTDLVNMSTVTVTTSGPDSSGKAAKNKPVADSFTKESVVISAYLTCPNDRQPFVLLDRFEKMVFKLCTSSRFNKRPTSSKRKRLTPPRLSINSLDFKNPGHLKILTELGIVVQVVEGDKVQVSHNMAKANSPEDAEEGWYLMQDIVKLMNQQHVTDGSQRQTPKLARILTPADLQERGIRHEFTVGPAMFGPELGVGEFQVGGELVEMKPIGGVLDNGCSEYDPQEARDIMGKILLINRGGCLFVLKTRTAQKAGAAGVIITDNVKQYNTTQVPPFSMSVDGSSDIIIPAVFMQRLDALLLRELLSNEAAVK